MQKKRRKINTGYPKIVIFLLTTANILVVQNVEILRRKFNVQ